MPLFNQALFDQILGTTPTLSEIAAYDAANVTYGQGAPPSEGTTYLGRFNVASEYDWQTFGVGTNPDETLALYIYDPAALYYAWYRMGGYTNAVYLDRATQHVVQYRSVIAPTYYPQPFYQATQGLALHYAATGDAESRNAIGRIADNMAGIVNAPWGTDSSGYYPLVGWPDLADERSWVRCLEPFVYAHAIGAPSTGGTIYNTSGGLNYQALAATCVTRILAAQGSDGAWRTVAHHPVGSPTPYYVKPFMTMLICNALILYSRLIQTDTRILPAIQAAINYLYVSGVYPRIWCPYPIVTPFDGQVRGNAFKYVEGDTAETDIDTQTIGSADLNGFFLQSHAWCFQQTGNAIWKTRANIILNGMQWANPKWYTKQLTESYGQNSYLAFPMLAGAAANLKYIQGKWR